MSIERPTSVNVVGWFFIIVGILSFLSATGYIVVSNINGQSISNTWPGFIQILIAGFLVYGGAGFLRGSPTMRRALEVASYLLIVTLLAFGGYLASDFASWMPLLGLAIYIIPLGFVIRALRSEKIKVYVSKAKT